MKQPIRAVLALASVLAGTTPAPAQLARSVAERAGQAPFSHLHTLYQKTILKVDVLTIDICFDAETAARIAPFAVRRRLGGAAGDSVARAALESRQARARVEFLRDVSLEDFLAGVRQDLWRAVEAGVLAEGDFRTLEAGLPEWYAPLARRGIRKGDQILYDMGPEAVRTSFLKRDGTAPLEHASRGRGLRNSPLATWFARGSPFRPGLLESLRESGRRGGAAPDGAGCGTRDRTKD